MDSGTRTLYGQPFQSAPHKDALAYSRTADGQRSRTFVNRWWQHFSNALNSGNSLISVDGDAQKRVYQQSYRQL